MPNHSLQNNNYTTNDINNFARNNPNNNPGQIIREEFKQHLDEGSRKYVKQKTNNNNSGPVVNTSINNSYTGGNYGFGDDNKNCVADNKDLAAEYGFQKPKPTIYPNQTNTATTNAIQQQQ